MASEFEPRKSDNVGGGSAMASKVDDLVVNTAAVTPMRMARDEDVEKEEEARVEEEFMVEPAGAEWRR
ncbi:hypothetical protein D8674_006146 [Pyrus ussuriensis x Pyrus communis]|uniref:Uncharacterized protein n=1 Tax=Pyrus ussuriensis x Pyrus communis TaxID=2448454 RepID=A0A5N5FTL0_9ROSA|nr:hypothetical protein D8674_006146 [Pyrus ussuriensis x Pyrus communis]